MVKLTRREVEIMELILLGNSNKLIAAQLNISESTVKNHITHTYVKLEVRNRAQAAVCYQKAKAKQSLWRRLWNGLATLLGIRIETT
jgi:DNA-binding NarL/FixJ family response regulator